MSSGTRPIYSGERDYIARKLFHDDAAKETYRGLSSEPKAVGSDITNTLVGLGLADLIEGGLIISNKGNANRNAILAKVKAIEEAHALDE